jgi:hypothetical protein
MIERALLAEAFDRPPLPEKTLRRYHPYQVESE